MTIEIQLQDPNFIYQVGDSFKGKVRFTTKKKSRIGKVMKIKFACTEIMKNHKNDSLSSHNVIFEQEIILLGADHEDSRVPVSDGMEFAFEFFIPFQDPELHYRGSLISRIGCVSAFSVYSVKALLTLADADKEFDFDERIVFVRPRFDKEDPVFREVNAISQEIALAERNSSVIVKSDSIKHGYLPNEKINYSFHLTNNTKRAIERIKSCIKRTIHFSAPNSNGKWERESEMVKNTLTYYSTRIPVGAQEKLISLSFPFEVYQPTIYGSNFVHSYELETILQFEKSTTEVVFYTSFFALPTSLEWEANLGYFARRERHMRSVRDEFDEYRRTISKSGA